MTDASRSAAGAAGDRDRPAARAPRAARTGGARPAAESAAGERLARLLDQQGVVRMRQTAWSVSVTMAVLAPLVGWVVGMPAALYYHALMALFVVSVWGQHLLARRTHGPWADRAFIAFNFALLTFIVVTPNPFSPLAAHPDAPALMLRFNNFVYFFILLAALAMSFSPGLVLWGGLCGAAFWSLGRLWVVSRPGADLGRGGAAEGDVVAFVEATLRPGYVDLGVWITEVVTLLVVSVLLAMAVRGSLALVRRQAALERRQANLSRYVPAQMAERMAEADQPFAEDREGRAVVMFTDLVGFTAWAETRPPDEVMDLLRGIHAVTAEQVFRAGGVLDKFIGDGTMATFGASAGPEGPMPEAEAAARALTCAEALLEAAGRFNAARVARGLDPAVLSVGLHLGPVISGDVGAAGRMELSVVGDAVNVASRLEAATRPLRTGAAASGAVMAAAGGAPSGWRLRGPLHLPGRQEAVTVWTLDRPVGDPSAEGQG